MWVCTRRTGMYTDKGHKGDAGPGTRPLRLCPALVEMCICAQPPHAALTKASLILP